MHSGKKESLKLMITFFFSSGICPACGIFVDGGNSTLNWWSMMAAITARMIIFKLHLVLIAETEFVILMSVVVCLFPQPPKHTYAYKRVLDK